MAVPWSGGGIGMAVLLPASSGGGMGIGPIGMGMVVLGECGGAGMGVPLSPGMGMAPGWFVRV